MKNHHSLTIQNIKKHYELNSACRAIIIIGSVARGDAGDESDVDYCIVTDKRQYKKRIVNNALTESIANCCISPCTEVNGIWTSQENLSLIRDHGRQSEKWAFTKAMVVYSKNPEIERLTAAIPVYPEINRQYRMESYHSQIYYHLSFFEFAFLSNTKYLIFETATKMILSVGRLLFEDNRLLYPGRKWFWRELLALPDKPDGICQLMLRFLDKPNIELGHNIVKCIRDCKSYPLPPEGMKQRIYKESTMNLEEW